MLEPLPLKRVTYARWAVVVVFLCSGLLSATLGSRLVVVRESLGVSPAGMGVLLLMITLGSIAMMPLAGRLIERFGEIHLLRVLTLVAWLAMVTAVFCATQGWTVLMAVPLFIQGAAYGAWDVSMNVAGARVEQGLGRAIMPQFHAGFSLATLLGAGVGWVFSRAGSPLLVHVGAVAIVGLVVVQLAITWLLPPEPKDVVAEASADGQSPVGSVELSAEDTTEPASAVRERSPWLEPRTLLIGVVMLSVSLTEGSANDWITSAVTQSFHTAETTGIVALGVFLAAMTAMRIFGTGLIDRWGRVATLRVCAVAAIVGLACFGLGQQLWLVLVGAAVWGLGAALGFPVGISAASDDPLRAARRTAVVSTVAYVAFLGGPPVLGMLAEHIGFRNALLTILVPAAATLLLAGWTAPLRSASPTDER